MTPEMVSVKRSEKTQHTEEIIPSVIGKILTELHVLNNIGFEAKSIIKKSEKFMGEYRVNSYQAFRSVPDIRIYIYIYIQYII